MKRHTLSVPARTRFRQFLRTARCWSVTGLAVAAAGCASELVVQRSNGPLPGPGSQQAQRASAAPSAPRPVPEAVQQVAYDAGTHVPIQPPLAVPRPAPVRPVAYFSAADARVPAESLAGTEAPVMEVVSATAMVHQFPDEYLLDGGDRGMKIHYADGARMGIETEDTVAEYRDHKGQPHTRESNPVAVYAPRFAAVRTISGPEEGIAIDRLAFTRDTTPGAAFTGRETLVTSNRRSKAGGFQTRERGSEVETLDAGVAMHTHMHAAGNVFVLKPVKRRQTLVGGQFEQASEAWLAARVKKAAAWSKSAFPVIQAVSASAMEVEATFRPQVLIGIEDQKTDGSLRILKLVDRDVAQQGDVLTFTIEFENVGDQPLHNIRIIDNLTPRLEYVEDSAGSDRPGDVVVEDNAEGSKLLRFELEGQLKGHDKGSVQFQARIR